MHLRKGTRDRIRNLLVNTVRKKLETYDPETSYMPFHFRLLGRDRYAIFSFIQSINTTFGISIWEQTAEILAAAGGNEAKRQFELLGEIDTETEEHIRDLHYRLRKGELKAHKYNEIRQIRNIIKKGARNKDPDSIVDFYTKVGSQENYFDITSAKPNMKEFVALKLKLLRWTGLRLSRNKNARVFTRLAIPYNPYHPESYERWTLSGLFDLAKGEVLVGEDFWDFIGNGPIYEELLDVFQEVGDELREEVDEKFSEFRNTD